MLLDIYYFSGLCNYAGGGNYGLAHPGQVAGVLDQDAAPR